MVILKPQQTSNETDMCTCRVEIEGEHPFPFKYIKKKVRSKPEKLGNTTWFAEVLWPQVALYCTRENASDTVTAKFRVRLLEGTKDGLGPDAVLFQGKSTFSGPELESTTIVTLKHDIGSLFDDFGELILGVDTKVVQPQGTPEVKTAPVIEEKKDPVIEEKKTPVTEEKKDPVIEVMPVPVAEKIPIPEDKPTLVAENKSSPSCLCDTKEDHIRGSNEKSFQNVEEKIPVAEENPKASQEENVQESKVNGHRVTFGNVEKMIPIVEENPTAIQEENIQESKVNGHRVTFGNVDEMIPIAEENPKAIKEENVQEIKVNGHRVTFGNLEEKIPAAEETPKAIKEENTQEINVNGHRVTFGNLEEMIPAAEENPEATQVEDIQENKVNGYRMTFGDLNNEETNASSEETQPPMDENWKAANSDQQSRLLELEIRLKERKLYKIDLEIYEMEQRMGLPHRYIENS